MTFFPFFLKSATLSHPKHFPVYICIREMARMILQRIKIRWEYSYRDMVLIAVFIFYFFKAVFFLCIASINFTLLIVLHLKTRYRLNSNCMAHTECPSYSSTRATVSLRNSFNITLISIPLLHSVLLIFTIRLKDQGFICHFSEHNKSRIFVFTLTHFKSELKSVI